jgi:hypothetical protein
MIHPHMLHPQTFCSPTIQPCMLFPKFFAPVCFIPERAGVFKMPIPCLLYPHMFHPQRKSVHIQTFVP